MNAVIIRFEGPLAVCRKESKTVFDLKRSRLPSDAEEGDILEIIGDRICINQQETRKAKQKVEDLIQDILS